MFLFELEGLAPLYDINFNDPANGKIFLSVSGLSENVNLLTLSDFIVKINVSNLNEGEHEVPITANGPSDVTFKLEKETARVSIVRKDV